MICLLEDPFYIPVYKKCLWLVTGPSLHRIWPLAEQTSHALNDVYLSIRHNHHLPICGVKYNQFKTSNYISYPVVLEDILDLSKWMILQVWVPNPYDSINSIKIYFEKISCIHFGLLASISCYYYVLNVLYI